jgi:hypothetical protein
MKLVGILPASGKASRIGGIPKFCLPISDERSMLQWHVEQMLEVCDEVRISTRAAWVPIVQNMDMNIKLIVKEPSTMSDAVKFLANGDDNILIGMPDTFMVDVHHNIYSTLLKAEGRVVLGAWECHEGIQGRVGQILIKDEKVISSKDKDPSCNYPHMWGTMMFRKMNELIDITLDHPGKQLQQWIDMGIDIRSVMPGGTYMDIGTLKGLKQLYREMEND